MKKYKVIPYKRGGWVIAEAKTDRLIIVFNENGAAEEACRFLNSSEE